MAYLPKLEHDLFLSYAHEDMEWVSALQEQLSERLGQLLECDCDVWQDKNKLFTGQSIPEELDRAIRASAAFIVVLSRNYRGSKWCEKELAAFLEETERKEGDETKSKVLLGTGGYRRLLRVIKFPWVGDAHKRFPRGYEDVKAAEFFEFDKAGEQREFAPKSAKFRDAVYKLSSDIEKLFAAMLLGFEKVFVAHAAEDAIGERESIIRDIRAVGHALSPPPEGAIPRESNREDLVRFIGEARVSVHLLGTAFDRDVREQIDLAKDAGKKMIFYLARGHEAASGEQRTLIDAIRRNAWNLPAGSYAFLEGRYQRQDLIELLRPPKPAAAGRRNGSARVYLLCDPTSEDAAFARELQGKIRDENKFDVELPKPAADSTSPGAEHERMLRWCDGLLLYRQSARDPWYSLNFKDLIMADDRKPKALLVAGSNVEAPGITVIQRRDPFDLQQLEPFLARLRTGQGDAAHAG